jgi:hypothetical protein
VVIDDNGDRVVGNLVRREVDRARPVLQNALALSLEQLNSGPAGYTMFICRDPDELLASVDFAAVDGHDRCNRA